MKFDKVPWTERMSPFRAPLDILTGCYPRFIFGGKVGRSVLPVFHFHEVTPDYLEPYLRYLAENGYRGASGEELLAVVEGQEEICEKTVLLTFDDAWTSLWTVAAPLLRRYQLHAMTFAIPGRVSGRNGLRPTIDDDPSMVDFGDRGEEPFCRWQELVELDREGVIEVESHTFAHEQIAVGMGSPGLVWTEEILKHTPLLSRPLVWDAPGSFRPLDHREFGQPVLFTRSRMSEGRKLSNGRRETIEEQLVAIRNDLMRCRDEFKRQMGRETDILCFPWAVAGKVAREEAKKVGYKVAFSDHFPGRRYVRGQSSKFQLMRLKHNWIYHLPGKGRGRLPLPK